VEILTKDDYSAIDAEIDEMVFGKKNEPPEGGGELCGILGDKAIRRRGLTTLQ
jgi:hypothetical protein